MFSTDSGVAQSFFLPSFVEVVELTKAMSTGRSRTVARREVKVMMVIVDTSAERSRGVWYVYAKMAAMRATRPTATAYATQMKAVWIRAIVGLRWDAMRCDALWWEM